MTRYIEHRGMWVPAYTVGDGLGTRIARSLWKLGIKQTPGCPCPKVQKRLDRLSDDRKNVVSYRGRYPDPLPAISGGSPGILFSEDFEGIGTGDLFRAQGGPISGNALYNALMAKGWNSVESFAQCNPYCGMQIVAAPGGRGGNVLKMIYNEGGDTSVNDSNNGQLFRNVGPVTEYYERFWFYLENPQPAFASPGSGNKWHYYNHFDYPNFVLDAQPIFTVVNQTQVAHTCPPGASGFNPDTTCNLDPNQGQSGSPSYNTWHCAEFHQGQSTVDLWLDNVLIISYAYAGTNVFYRPTYSDVMIFRQGGKNLIRYEDDYVAGDTRIGCGGVAVDFPPAPPTGFRFA